MRARPLTTDCLLFVSSSSTLRRFVQAKTWYAAGFSRTVAETEAGYQKFVGVVTLVLRARGYDVPSGEARRALCKLLCIFIGIWLADGVKSTPLITTNTAEFNGSLGQFFRDLAAALNSLRPVAGDVAELLVLDSSYDITRRFFKVRTICFVLQCLLCMLCMLCFLCQTHVPLWVGCLIRAVSRTGAISFLQSLL